VELHIIGGTADSDPELMIIFHAMPTDLRRKK
jgi:hypothetical protein